MHLTSFTDFGLRMLMRMASAPERAFSTTEMGEDFVLSRHHLSKIMQRLSQGGRILTRHGAGGGSCLLPPSGEWIAGAEYGRAC